MYEGVQAGNRGQCQKYPEPERMQCLESANVRYEDYERERNKSRTE